MGSWLCIGDRQKCTLVSSGEGSSAPPALTWDPGRLTAGLRRPVQLRPWGAAAIVQEIAGHSDIKVTMTD
jgi:hypothetical protein